MTDEEGKDKEWHWGALPHSHWLRPPLPKARIETRWTEIDIPGVEPGSIKELDWPEWDRIYIRTGSGAEFVSQDQGETFVRAMTWKDRVRFWWSSYAFRVIVRARFVLTGDCGHICGMTTFTSFYGVDKVEHFVPEDGCPVHDREFG